MIDIINKNISEKEFKEVEKLIIPTVKSCLIELEFEDDIELSVSLVDEEEIRVLNRDFRNKDSVTDVLSFPQYTEDGFEAYEDEPVYIGDIVICTKRAREQALEYGHSFEREISYLCTHGVLHLMGYDHIEEADKLEMRAMEKKVMIRMNLAMDGIRND